MATLVLAAAGSALGGMMGGSMAGITSLALGKAAGASLGSLLDQKILGLGSQPVESGKVDRFRVMGSSEGSVLPRVFGRVRLAGQIIWSSRFLENSSTQHVGGKGGGQEVREYSYSVSIAVAICQGEIVRVGRIWADGIPVDQSTLSMSLYTGTDDQPPDPTISAIERKGATPAYRGTAYVVFENLDLSPFGNRIPQFNFEVFRRTEPINGDTKRHPALDIRGVALIPGTGEYALATERVQFDRGMGDNEVINIHNDRGVPDLIASLDQLHSELPEVESVSLVVTWFGSDLRCNHCTLEPKVEQNIQDGTPMHWQVAGISRSDAKVISKLDDRPVFGGTPSDASVIQSIKEIRRKRLNHPNGRAVLFYPFILMDILPANGLPDPWTNSLHQLPIPWRGRITLPIAPGRHGSADQTNMAADEVKAFFGSAQPEHFEKVGNTVRYIGPDPDKWTYRRFILHYARLCEGEGIDAFCIGSELRSLTQIRGGLDDYPAVAELRDLASAVRGILGPNTKIGYAADWSEYFGHQPVDGSGDVIFHLDPLWSDREIDFIGIDNYMPLSDWRDGVEHLDASANSIYNTDYLEDNISSGEGFDWFYKNDEDRSIQNRTEISDGAYGEHWIYRYKDLEGWWKHEHHNRKNGVRLSSPTGWMPMSKPIWFTELGCPAIDKGTNQPNVFYDSKSSESAIPYYSNGNRDEYIQYCYLQANYKYWNDESNNPLSTVYHGPMVDMSRAHVWAWDSRPWPDFPTRSETWTDGENYNLGHWLNGRTSIVSLSDLVREICQVSDLEDIDTSLLFSSVTGFIIQSVESPRQSLQGLMLTFGFDAFETAGQLTFLSRSSRPILNLDLDALVVVEGSPGISRIRSPESEITSRVSIGYIRSDMDYQTGAADAVFPGAAETGVSQLSVPIVFSETEAQKIACRWLSEGRISRDTLIASLPLSTLGTTGDLISVNKNYRSELFRIDHVDHTSIRQIKCVRVESETYNVPAKQENRAIVANIPAQTAAYVDFLDLPLISNVSSFLGFHVAVAKKPWTGPIAIYSSENDDEYRLGEVVSKAAIFGITLESITAGISGCWMNRSLKVKINSGVLQNYSDERVLQGKNLAALRFGGKGDWEVFQFCNAQLLDETGVYKLDRLLRGQAGTDCVVPDEWPEGSEFIILNNGLTTFNISDNAQESTINFRVGPAVRSILDDSYIHRSIKFMGNSFRPYAPVYLSVTAELNGNLLFEWVRRTRVGGDNWSGVEIPVGENSELYHVKVMLNGEFILDDVCSEPKLFLANFKHVKNLKKIVFKVCQISERFGDGPYSCILWK